MPHRPTTSASGRSGIGSMFSSTIVTSQCAGHSAARVASPSGGLTARWPDKIALSIHSKLQKLSGNRGLIRSRRMEFLSLDVRRVMEPDEALAADRESKTSQPDLLQRNGPCRAIESN